jgi:transglutaminase-like putative cysteine protease
VANHQLGPGDAYLVKVYAPNPTGPELAAAGESYPASFSYYRELFVPSLGGGNPPPGAVVFPSFGSAAGPATRSYAASTMASSPYAAAYRLAQRLAAGASTPYAFVERVERYLQHGYTYEKDAPRSAYPLETFLFKAKYGYCQQFAGAMALLLRMEGVPARVAVGFTPGTYSSTNGQWVVNDTEAHAWVEVWFPSYGWVAFNPTPAAAPASTLASTPGTSRPRVAGGLAKLHATGTGSATRGRLHAPSGFPLLATVAVVLVLGLVLGGLGLGWRRRRPRGVPSSDELLAELERALRRTGFLLTPAMTLAELERRLRRAPRAAEYVHALRLARYAGVTDPPTRGQRRALRAQLAEGRGLFGRLRALWALPPRL